MSEYEERTSQYRSEGRPVRITGECRSACTLALSLPTTCVTPNAVVRFHQAYNRDTKEIDHRISQKLFDSYPRAVQDRLGELTREYKSLSGRALISLGIPACAPERAQNGLPHSPRSYRER